VTREGDGDDAALVVALLLVVAFFGGPWRIRFINDFPAASFSGREWQWGGSAASDRCSLPHTRSPRG
jgi:hypothetical protein